MTTVATRPDRADVPRRRRSGRRTAVAAAAALLLALALLASLALGSRPLAVDQVWHALTAPDGGEATSHRPGAAPAADGPRADRRARARRRRGALPGTHPQPPRGTADPRHQCRRLVRRGPRHRRLRRRQPRRVRLVRRRRRARRRPARPRRRQRHPRGGSPVTLALVGAALDASLAAGVYALLSIDARTFEEYRFWVVGGLTGRDVGVAGQVLPFVLAGLALAALVARGLDALALGDDVARGLGHRIGLVRLGGGAAAVLLTGAAVAAAGPIAFVGLAVPHLARALVGADHRWTLAVSALLGPALLLGADVVGRLVAPPGEVPAGIVTALIGAPLLAYLVRRAKVVTA